MSIEKKSVSFAVFLFFLLLSCLFCGCENEICPTASTPSSQITSTTTTSTTTTTTVTTTSRTTTTTTETTTTTTTAPPVPLRELYKNDLAIAGDSIASGFGIYGYIPKNNSIAKESVGLGNIAGATFKMSFGNAKMVDAVATLKPKLLLVSLGMNDLPRNNPEWFATEYEKLVMSFKEVSPDSIIIAAGVTPISPGTKFSTNENIRNYNEALKNMIVGLGDSRIYYFDAYTPLTDSDTLAMRSGLAAKDGIHLNSSTYEIIMSALFDYLETTDVRQQLSDE